MPALPQVPLGRSELRVSRLALGSWRTFEHMSRDDGTALLAHAHAQGITFFDDARYDDETSAAPIASGCSEVLFGELFRAAGVPRDDMVISNKLWWELWPEQSAVEELEGSLERMGFEHIDLLSSSTLPDELPVASTLLGATRPAQIDANLESVAVLDRLGADGLATLRATGGTG